MDQLIALLVYVVIFAIVAYGLWWVCVRFKLPEPAFWICGVILLVFLLVFIRGQLASSGGALTLPRGK